MPEIKYEITTELGKLSETESGWAKEANLVSWNGRDPIYDIRTWNRDHTRLGKGITLTKAEAAALRDILNKLDI
mgnify:CR=1 FL=1